MTEQSDASDNPEDVDIADDAAALDAFDLDHDGHISLVEDARAELGVLDARAEEMSQESGLKGQVGKAAHRILDKLDND